MGMCAPSWNFPPARVDDVESPAGSLGWGVGWFHVVSHHLKIIIHGYIFLPDFHSL